MRPSLYGEARPTMPTVLPEWLTTDARKALLYGHEAYFREAWHDAQTIIGNERLHGLRQFTYVLFKPDAVLARAIGRAIEVLAEEDFRPVSAATFRFDRVLARELWRYELNIATLQRLEAIDVLLPTTDSLLVVLQDIAELPAVPASEKLRLTKGPALKRLRSLEDIRTRIGAHDGMLNFIHCPDDTSDMVREIGLLLAPAARFAAFQAIARALSENAVEPPVLTEAVQRLYRQAADHDMNVSKTLDRIAAAFRASKCPCWQEYVDILDVARRRGHSDWKKALDAAQLHGVPVAKEDWAVVAAACTEPDLPGLETILSKPSPAASAGAAVPA